MAFVLFKEINHVANFKKEYVLINIQYFFTHFSKYNFDFLKLDYLS